MTLSLVARALATVSLMGDGYDAHTEITSNTICTVLVKTGRTIGRRSGLEIDQADIVGPHVCPVR